MGALIALSCPCCFQPELVWDVKAVIDRSVTLITSHLVSPFCCWSFTVPQLPCLKNSSATSVTISTFALLHTGQCGGLFSPQRNSFPFSQRHHGGSKVITGRDCERLSVIGFTSLIASSVVVPETHSTTGADADLMDRIQLVALRCGLFLAWP
jgi:hypothetical protein